MRRTVRQVQEGESEAVMGSVQDSEHVNPWCVTLLVNGKLKIDTGADVTVIPKDVYEGAPARKTLSGPSHAILPVSESPLSSEYGTVKE